MTDDDPGKDFDQVLVGRTAPPMANGEVVFDEPWQGRTFGMARALCQEGLFAWDEFRERLIAEIAAWETEHSGEDDYPYFDLFLAALERLLLDKGICEAGEIEALSFELVQRPHGHDH